MVYDMLDVNGPKLYPIVRLIEISKHRFIRAKGVRDIQDIKYSVTLEFEDVDRRIHQRGPFERTMEQLESLKAIDFMRIAENYWKDRNIYPKYAREILSNKVNLVLHKALWDKLPYEESSALFLLEERNQLVYWQPHYNRGDVARIDDQIALQNLKAFVRVSTLQEDPTLVDHAAPPQSPMYTPPATPISMNDIIIPKVEDDEDHEELFPHFDYRG
jgi:hypothetical protein